MVAFEQKLNLWSLSGHNRYRLTLKVCPTKLSKNCLWILVRLDQSEVSITTLSTNHSSPGHTRGEVGPVLQQSHHLPCKVHILYYIWSLPLYQYWISPFPVPVSISYENIKVQGPTFILSKGVNRIFRNAIFGVLERYYNMMYYKIIKS